MGHRVALSALAAVAVVGVLGCGGAAKSRTTRTTTESRASTEVLEFRTSGLGRAYVKIRASIPVVRLTGHMMAQGFRGGGSMVTSAPTVHGRRRCSVVFVVGSGAPGGLSAYAGQRTAISVFGNADISHALCSVWKSG